jgi:hypothetical protein
MIRVRNRRRNLDHSLCCAYGEVLSIEQERKTVIKGKSLCLKNKYADEEK